MRQLLWWLIGGSRGGKNRLRILRTLQTRPMNTNQLSNELALNYKTVQHHLEVLEENDVVTTRGDNYGKMYFLTDRMRENLDILEEIAEQQRIQNAVLFELARTLDHRLPELRKHPPEEPSNPRSGRSLASWVEDAALDLDERVDLNAVDRVSEGSQ